jgi:cation transport regulator ChaC
MGDHVFGYASLLTDMRREEEELCRLHGYRRSWNVATDNSLTLGRYKIYRDPATGRQPPVFVTFVNLVPDGEAAVAGVLFAVTPAQLAELDLRERNYERRDVSAEISDTVDGPVWCYFGTAEAEARYRQGAASERAVISRAYYERVRDGFAACGAAALASFQASTEEPRVPIVELERVDVT